jgi:hypothetical protein
MLVGVVVVDGSKVAAKAIALQCLNGIYSVNR